MGHETKEFLLDSNLVDSNGTEFFLFAHVKEGERIDSRREDLIDVLETVGKSPALEIKEGPRSNGMDVLIQNLCERIDFLKRGKLMDGNTTEKVV